MNQAPFDSIHALVAATPPVAKSAQHETSTARRKTEKMRPRIFVNLRCEASFPQALVSVSGVGASRGMRRQGVTAWTG